VWCSWSVFVQDTISLSIGVGITELHALCVGAAAGVYWVKLNVEALVILYNKIWFLHCYRLLGMNVTEERVAGISICFVEYIKCVKCVFRVNHSCVTILPAITNGVLCYWCIPNTFVWPSEMMFGPTKGGITCTTSFRPIRKINFCVSLATRTCNISCNVLNKTAFVRALDVFHVFFWYVYMIVCCLQAVLEESEREERQLQDEFRDLVLALETYLRPITTHIQGTLVYVHRHCLVEQCFSSI